MKSLLQACVLSLLMMAQAQADSPSEIDEVLVPLKAYLEGHATGQEAPFRRAFAADAVLYGHRDEQ